MPLLIPNKEEKKDEFISRCMANNKASEEFPDEAQRYAICAMQWKRKQENNKEE